MKKIDDCSDKEFMTLVKELNSQETYLEKVKFFYEKTGRFRGYKRTIMDKEYSFSVKTQDDGEQLIFWQYFVEQRAKAYCKVWMDKNAFGMDMAEDKTRTIGILLYDIENEVMGNNDLKWGYNYGIKKTGLHSINLDVLNIESLMAAIGKGLGLYYAELELEKLKHESVDEESILDIKTNFSEGYRLVLLEELGIISYIMDRYEIPSNQPTKLSKVLAEIMGIDTTSARNRSFLSSVKHLLNKDEEKGPSNQTSRRQVEAFLTKIGIHFNKEMKKK